MPIQLDQSVTNEVRAAINQAFESGSTAAQVAPTVHVFQGDATINVAAMRAALDAGETIAIVDARTGQLADLDPGTGCEVTTDLALFAIKRLPIPGYPKARHTIVSMVPNASQMKREQSDAQGNMVQVPAPAAPPDYAFLAGQLRQHVEDDFAAADDVTQNVLPPTGTLWGQQTLNFAGPFNFDSSNTVLPNGVNGNTQTITDNVTQTYYIYYANGITNNEQYVIFMVQSGGVQTAANGTFLVSNQNASRAWALSNATVGVQNPSSNMTLQQASPAPTVSSPVSDSASYSMMVMADGDGGSQATAFTASWSNSVTNDGWAVAMQGPAQWLYYNNNNAQTFPGDAWWDGSQQTAANWLEWYPQIFNGTNNVAPLPSQAANGMSYETLVVWTVLASLPAITFTALCGNWNVYNFGAGLGILYTYTVGGSWALSWNLQTITGAPQS